MARSENLIFKGAHGKIGNFLVIKQRGKNTFFSMYPSNTGRKRKLSPKQMAYAELMQNAAWNASGILKNPAEREAALLRLDVTSKQLYHALVKEYIKENKDEKLANPHDRNRVWHKRQFSKKKYDY